MEEIWKRIPNYPSYEVSNLGRIRSWRTMGNGPNKVDKKEPTILKPILTPYGYMTITLRGLKDRRMMVHRLVLEAFVGPPPTGKPVTRHLNSVRHDNRLENLCWGSMKENMADCKEIGHYHLGSKRSNSKLTEEQVKTLRRLHKSGTSYEKLGKMFGICIAVVGDICHYRTWKHVTED